MARTDSASRLVGADAGATWRALVDPEALMAWLPPAGMTGRFEAYDPRPGGGYRMVLTYAAGGQGKSGADSDVVDARFAELVPGERIVQLADFESDDPAFAGTMRITWSLAAEAEGTRVTVTCEDVPAGIRKEDHDAGLGQPCRLSGAVGGIDIGMGRLPGPRPLRHPGLVPGSTKPHRLSRSLLSGACLPVDPGPSR